MSLQAEAQLLEIVELDKDHPLMEMVEPEMEFIHAPDLNVELHSHESHEAGLEIPESNELVVDELPGVEGLDPELEKALEVSEEKETKDKSEKDENEARTSKKITKWDWEAKGANGFIAWVKERLSDVPKHSGYDTAGCERAIAYLEKLDNEISRAMRLDLDGELDADKIEEVRSKLDDGIERLHGRLDKIKKKHGKKRKKADIDENSLIKEAQKIAGIEGIVVTVPLYVSAIARTCINGMVSGGHDIEDMFERLAKKFKLTDRERMECIYHMMDMGLPIRRDRGIMLDEDFDPGAADNFDWPASRPA